VSPDGSSHAWAGAGRATETGYAADPGAAAGAAPPYLELEALSVRFGSVLALREITLEVGPGDLLAVVGPDGAGKTTLVRAMAGLVRPAGGRVLRRLESRRMGFCGADFDLYGDLTVRENLTFFGSVRGMTGAQIAETGERLLALVGLEDARDRLAARLSGGMKKKLSLAAALIHDPALLLLDEPTVGMDPGSRRELWDIVAQANAWGAAVVFTSPYLDEAERAQRVAVLSGGRMRNTSPVDLLHDAAGWKAWLAGLDGARRTVRLRLAQAALGPRVYLRPEGLAVLARGEEEARRLAETVLGAGAGLVPAELTLEDAFVLTQEERPAGANGGPQ
jgi:ABC-2 type transport system ATP-binding protein